MDGCGCVHRALSRRVSEVTSRLNGEPAAAGRNINASFSHRDLFKLYLAAFFFEPVSYKYGNTHARSCLLHTEEKRFIFYVAA